jgi:hypothetical protein
MPNLTTTATPTAAPSPNATPAAAPAKSAPAASPSPDVTTPAPDGDFDSELSSLGKEPSTAPQTNPDAKVESKSTPDAAKPVAAKPTTPEAKPAKPLSHEHFEKVSSELKAEREAKTALEAKIAEYESRGQDTGKLTEALTAKEAEIAALKAEKAALKFEASDDFKQNHEAKYGRAAESAMKFTESLMVAGSEDGAEPPRKATRQDFVNLYHTATADQAQKAQDMFGINGQRVLARIESLKDMQEQADLALEAEKKNWSDNAKTRESKEIQDRETATAERIKACTAMAEKEPDIFGQVVGDEEGNKLLQEGFAAVDTYPRTPQERVAWESSMRMKTAAFPRLVAQRKADREKIAELESTIAEMKRVGPGAGVGECGRDGDVPAEDDFDAALRKELR